LEDEMKSSSTKKQRKSAELCQLRPETRLALGATRLRINTACRRKALRERKITRVDCKLTLEPISEGATDAGQADEKDVEQLHFSRARVQERARERERRMDGG